MKSFVMAAVAGMVLTAGAFAGEKSQAAVQPVAKQAVKGDACACQVVEATRRPLLGRRNACAEKTVLVPATKTVTVYETKKVLVEKEVKVPVKKEVTTLVPAKVVSAPACDCCSTAVAAPVRRLGNRLRGATVSVAECVTCK